MDLQTFIFSTLLTIIITLCVLGTFFVVIRVLIKSRTKFMQLDITELFQAINIIVSNEISMYERNAFDNGGKMISNATYENYYKDIMKNIYTSLSPDIIDRLSFYINKESLYTMISKEVKIYLNSKIM